MPRSLLSIALAWIVALAVAGCAKEEAHHSGSIEFRVNESRLGARFSQAGAPAALRAPAGWNPLADSLVAQAMARLGGAPVPRMLAMYRQEPEGAVLSVSGYPETFAAAQMDSIAVARLAALHANRHDAQIVDGRFSYHGWQIVQFRTVDAKSVEFQLLLAGTRPPLMQLDYVVPRAVYPRELESIESSIGSLEPSS